MSNEGTWIVNDRLKPQHTCAKPSVSSAPECSVWRCKCGQSWQIKRAAWTRLTIGEAALIGVAQVFREARTRAANEAREAKP